MSPNLLSHIYRFAMPNNERLKKICAHDQHCRATHINRTAMQDMTFINKTKKGRIYMNNTANTVVETAAGSTNDIFANLDALRLSSDAAAINGTTEILSHIPLRKPNRHEFFRTRPEPEMWFDTGIFEDKEEREVFFVTPAMREALVGESN
jgi:hypothetical protein